jgi:hypothetical protein
MRAIVRRRHNWIDSAVGVEERISCMVMDQRCEEQTLTHPKRCFSPLFPLGYAPCHVRDHARGAR